MRLKIHRKLFHDEEDASKSEEKPFKGREMERKKYGELGLPRNGDPLAGAMWTGKAPKAKAKGVT